MPELTNMLLMHKETVIAQVNNQHLKILNEKLMPYFLLRTGDITAWLRERAIDSHRTHSRILKRALRLKSKDDLEAVLYVHAATITDNYWIKQASEAITYADVRFKTNAFDRLALMGDVNSLDLPPEPTPEITNIGSFEKCWTQRGNQWYISKAGSPKEQFSEMFAWHVGRVLGFRVAEYEYEESYVISKDFTENGKYDFDPANGFSGEETDYFTIYKIIKALCPAAAQDYIKMCYLDALIYNFDRHEHNFGLLRDSETGSPVCLAPLFDHNLSLISRTYPTAKNYADMLVRDFAELLSAVNKPFAIQAFSRKTLAQICKAIPITLPRENGVHNPRPFVVDYVMNRQSAIFSLCKEHLEILN